MTIVLLDESTSTFHIYDDRGHVAVPVKEMASCDRIGKDQDVIYVTSGHRLTGEQFHLWVQGGMKLSDADSAPAKPKPRTRFLRTVAGGAFHIPDLRTTEFPNGIVVEDDKLVPLTGLSDKELRSSARLQELLRQKKLTIVWEKRTPRPIKRLHRSARDKALESILLPPDVRVRDVISAGSLEAYYARRNRTNPDEPMVWEGIVG